MNNPITKLVIPKSIVKNEDTATETYAQFIVEPLESGYGYTIGNTLRRILLSSIEGAAISSIKIDGIDHELQIKNGVVEDVTDIIINLKKVLLISQKIEPVMLKIDVTKEGPVTAGDIEPDSNIYIVNPNQKICTLDRNNNFNALLEVKVGRGYRTAEENKPTNSQIGLIPIDSIFSPVRMVNYSVNSMDYDKLIIEIHTDGRISPSVAIKKAASILRKHLEIFNNITQSSIDTEKKIGETEVNENRMKELLTMSVNEIELSVRSINCLNNANITTLGELVKKSEQDMLKYRNFGKKSLNEIKTKLKALGLSLGMKIKKYASS